MYPFFCVQPPSPVVDYHRDHPFPEETNLRNSVEWSTRNSATMDCNAADLEGFNYTRLLVKFAESIYETRVSESTKFEDVFQDSLDNAYSLRTSDEEFSQALKKSRSVLFQMIACIDEELDASSKGQNDHLLDYVPSLHNYFCSLPVEIISKIFEDVVIGSNGNEYAVTLASINRQCREIAIGLPSIWSILYCLFPLNVLSLYLERSKTAKLSVYIDDDEPHVEFLEILRSAYDRIAYLDISYEEQLQKFLRIFSGLELRELTSLRLMTEMEGFSSSMLSSVSMPNLTHYDGKWFYADQRSPWMSNITDCTFMFSVATPELITSGQIQLPRCETLRLQFHHIGDPYLKLPSNFPQPTALYNQSSVLPNLMRLSIEIGMTAYIGYAESIVRICVPTEQLQNLEMTMPNGLKKLPLERQFNNLCFRSLRSLKITEYPVYDHVSNIFMDLGQLEHLKICGSLSKGYMRYLRYGNVQFLQNLKTVEFDSCSRMEEDEVMEMAEHLTAIPVFNNLELRRCQLERSLLTKLQRLYPGKFKWS